MSGEGKKEERFALFKTQSFFFKNDKQEII